MKNVIKKYTKEIIDRPYLVNDDIKYEKTVILTFFGRAGKTETQLEYGFISREDIYKMIKEGQPLNLDNCFVEDFSLAEYKELNNIDKNKFVKIIGFSAVNAFFECEEETDFSFAEFDEANVYFNESRFSDGNINFYKTRFGPGNIEFTNTKFGEGKVNFQYAEMGKGSISFQNASFDKGSLSFVNAAFNKGKVNFKNCLFNGTKVSFQYARFGKGNISFYKARFSGKSVDFRRVDFKEGKVDFRKTDFGNGQVLFEEAIFGEGKVNFKSSKFGEGETSFRMADFGSGETLFENVDFGSGNVSFAEVHAEILSLKGCHLDNYLDLRINQADKIDLSDTIVRDIIDVKPLKAPVNIKVLDISGMRNLGRIFIDWKENEVHRLITTQENTSDREKANQFRTLKQDFNNTGNYSDEDKAYVAFKRFEMKAEQHEHIKTNKWNALWVYPSNLFKWLVFDKMGLYATDPLRVLFSMVVMYVIFSLTYIALPEFTHADLVSSVGDPDKLNVTKKAFYHSAITFLTIGYGDYYPSGHTRWLSAVEGWVGLFLMSYFTVAFVRKILR